MKNRLHSLQTLTRWLSNFRNVINRPQSILTRRADISKRAIWMLLVLLLLYLAIPLPNPLFPQDYSTVVLDRDGGVVIPAAMVEDVVKEGPAQERAEAVQDLAAPRGGRGAPAGERAARRGERSPGADGTAGAAGSASAKNF